jgi:hypothetical protein
MEGEKFSLHKEATTFTRPTQYKSFAVPAIRVKKMFPNSTHTQWPLKWPFGALPHLKGGHYSGRSAAKG